MIFFLNIVWLIFIKETFKFMKLTAGDTIRSEGSLKSNFPKRMG